MFAIFKETVMFGSFSRTASQPNSNTQPNMNVSLPRSILLVRAYLRAFLECYVKLEYRERPGKLAKDVEGAVATSDEHLTRRLVSISKQVLHVSFSAC